MTIVLLLAKAVTELGLGAVVVPTICNDDDGNDDDDDNNEETLLGDLIIDE